MRVLFDLSVLLLAIKHTTARTGVFRVVDEVARGLTRTSGLQVFWSTYLESLSVNDSIRELREHFPTYSIEKVKGRYATGVYKSFLKGARRVALSRYGRLPILREVTQDLRQHGSLRACDLRSIDIIHSPYFEFPCSTLSNPRLARVLTIYDLIPFLDPLLFEGQGDPVRRAVGNLRTSDWVVCISESTRRDLMCIRPDLNPDRIFVTPLAAASTFHAHSSNLEKLAVRSKYGIPADLPYFLSVCTLEPRKNLQHVLEAFLEWKRSDNSGTVLVLAGVKGWKIDHLFDSVRELPAGKVIITGFVDDADLAPLYADATAFVYMSKYEGFGLPPLEAMCCGTPVVVSDNSSLPEVVGDAGILLPCNDKAALITVFSEITENADLRASLHGRGLIQARKFSWDKCIDKTVQVYLKAYEEMQKAHRR